MKNQKKHKWEQEEIDRIISLRELGHTYEEIALILGNVNRNQVMHAFKRIDKNESVADIDNRYWTDEDTNTIFQLKELGKSDIEIGKVVNRTPAAVKARLTIFREIKNLDAYAKVWSKDETNQLISLYNEGIPYIDICNIMDITYGSMVRKITILSPTGVLKRLDRNLIAQLDKEIIEMFNDNISYPEMAKNLNVKKSFIRSRIAILRKIGNINGVRADTNPVDIDKMIHLRNEGYVDREISEIMGITSSRTKSIFHNLLERGVIERKCKSRSSSRAVSVEDTNLLIQMYNEYKSYEYMADKLNLSVSGVQTRLFSLIRKGKITTRKSEIRLQQETLSNDVSNLIDQGYTINRIYRKLKVPAHNVKNALKSCNKDLYEKIYGDDGER